MSNLRNQVGNPVMTFLLRSPLHGLLSKNMLLITVTGRKSGKSYTTPVGYVRSGAELLIVSSPDRSWWKNLRGGAPITIHLQGSARMGIGTAIEDPARVAESLIEMLKAAPQYQNFFKVSLTPDGRPIDPTALAEAVKARVMVKITGLRP
ncbi:MAG: nitroreductase family deazaflavin-dependent oxidoreductase [Anaerolineae bacterium]